MVPQALRVELPPSLAEDAATAAGGDGWLALATVLERSRR